MNSSGSSRDWEEDLAQIIGDPLAFQIGYRVRDLQQKSLRIKQDGAQMLSEYVRYELDLLPSKNQVEQFCGEVKACESQLNRLEEKLNALTAKKGF
jgi:ubiquinone biosynthesis protein UbiJ